MLKIIAAIVLTLALFFGGAPAPANAAVCGSVTPTVNINGDFSVTINSPHPILEVNYVSLWNVGGIVRGGHLNGTNTVSGTVQRADATKGFTLEVNLRDACGTHRTFVGHGQGWSPNTGFPG